MTDRDAVATVAPWVPIERQLLESTVWETDPVVRVLFVTLLLIAHEPGRRGRIDMTLKALAGRACLSPDDTKRALEVLMAPDPESRSSEEEGRRVAPIDPSRPWGWRLVTWEKRAELHRRALATARKRRQRATEEDDEADDDPHGGHDASRNVTPGHATSQRKGNGKGKGKRQTNTRGNGGELAAPPPASSPAPARRPSPADLLATWNANRGPLPAAEELNDERKRKANARLRDCPDLERWATGIRRAAASSFCQGDNDRGWRATFDFFLKPSTLTKALEGAYEGKTPRSGYGYTGLAHRAAFTPPSFHEGDPTPPGVQEIPASDDPEATLPEPEPEPPSIPDDLSRLLAAYPRPSAGAGAAAHWAGLSPEDRERALSAAEHVARLWPLATANERSRVPALPDWLARRAFRIDEEDREADIFGARRLLLQAELGRNFAVAEGER